MWRDWSSDVCSSDLTERAGKRTGERGKEELPLKQKATVCTPSKGADRGYFFNFRPRHFQPWAN